MKVENLMKDLRLNKIRNIIIYASFIILVISLLLPLVNLDNNLVQRISLIFFLYGLFLWGLEHLVFALSEVIGKSDNEQGTLFFFWVVFVLIGFLIAFREAFGINFMDLLKIN